jgi:hypothetical protein
LRHDRQTPEIARPTDFTPCACDGDRGIIPLIAASIMSKLAEDPPASSRHGAWKRRVHSELDKVLELADVMVGSARTATAVSRQTAMDPLGRAWKRPGSRRPFTRCAAKVRPT